MARILNLTATNSLDDEALLKQFKEQGDQEALASLFLRYSDLLYGVCFKYLGEAENARDAVMHIYQELLKKLPVHEVHHFKSWVYVLAKNYCLMQLRQSKKNITVNIENQVVQSGGFMHLDSIIEKEETFKKLERCLEHLPAEQGKTIRLFYYDNKCYNEIAASTGLEWNRVRSLIQNGRRNLKICMDKNEA